MSFTSLEQLTAVISLILEYPGGLNVLTGKIDPPKPEELYRLIESCKQPVNVLGVRVEGGAALPEAERVITLADTFERIVNRFGGWPHIVETTKQWAEVNQTSWRLVVDHHRWVKNNQSRLNGSQLERIAEINGVGKESICRLIKRFPGELADAILRAPIEHREAV